VYLRTCVKIQVEVLQQIPRSGGQLMNSPPESLQLFYFKSVA